MHSIRLSPSSVQKYLTCPRTYWYAKVKQLQSRKTPVNLVFGRCIDDVTSMILRCFAKGLPIPSPGDAWDAAWDAALHGQDVEFTNKAMGPKELRLIGRTLSERFPEKWAKSGLTVATLPNGEPAVQVKLEADLGGGVSYLGYLDVMAFNDDAELGIIDIKSAAMSAAVGFDSLAPQLTDYQILTEANAGLLGIDVGDVRWNRFIELLKSKGDPRIELRLPGKRRGPEEVSERLVEIRNVARDIRAHHFPRRAGIAFSSPCRMCEFLTNCLAPADFSGLITREQADQQRQQAKPKEAPQKIAFDLPSFDYYDLDYADEF